MLLSFPLYFPTFVWLPWPILYPIVKQSNSLLPVKWEQRYTVSVDY